MESKRVLILEQDGVRAESTAALVLQSGHLAVGPVRDLEEAIARASRASIDAALLQRRLDDGTDSTPVAELLSAANIPYAFVIEPGDPTSPDLFPNATFLRRPLSLPPIEGFLSSRHRAETTPFRDATALAEIELVKGKIQDTAIRAEAKGK